MKAKVAVVLGASGAIGMAIARRLGAEGWDLALHAHRRGEALGPLVAELEGLGRRCLVLQADLSGTAWGEGLAEAVAEGLGPATGLVFAAGQAEPELVLSQGAEEWDATLAVHARAPFLACQAFLPGMIRAKGGSIVLVGSVAGRSGSPGLAAYALAKGGLVAFARSLAAEVGPRGVRVNVLAPGPVEGPLLAELPPERLEAWAQASALRRLARPEDLAGPAAFLLSEAAAFITGACLPVDGGLGALA